MKRQTCVTSALGLVLLSLLALKAGAQILISAVTNTGYSQNFDTLANSGTANGWTNNSTLAGWYANQENAPFAVTNYRASTGSETAGALYSFGASASTERAFGSQPSTTPGDISFGLRFMNNTSLAMTNITVSFTGEQWRRTTNGGMQTVVFAYCVGSSAITNADPLAAIYVWTPKSALNFNSPNPGGLGIGNAALDGNFTTNKQSLTSGLDGVLLLPGQELFLRWLDVDDSASDYGMGIDDLSVTFTPVSFSDPAINVPPVSRTNAVQTTATFSVGASGLSTIYYQWFKGITPLTNGPTVSGVTNDTLTLSQILHADAGSYSVVVSNTAGSLTSAPVTLTVVGFAIAPVAPTNTLAGTPVSVGLRYMDNQTSVNSLTGISSNPGILTNASISGTSAGSSGSATLTPSATSKGVVLVTLTASDGSFATNTTFALMVRPSTNVIFNDYFDYPDGGVVAGSQNLWIRESGTAGGMIVTAGALQVTRSASELAYAELVGQPYLATGTKVLYSRFKLHFANFPTANGNYFAYFRDASGNGRRGRIWTSITNAVAGKFRLGIGNGSQSSSATAQVEQDLETNVTYTVVTRLDVSNAVSAIWINPTTEFATNSTNFVLATDAPTSGASDITSYAFRQASSEGVLFVDDLVIGTSFPAVLGTMAPVPENITCTVNGGNLILNWTQLNWSGLLSGTDITALTTTNLGVRSPFTNAIGGQQKYFRLFWKP